MKRKSTFISTKVFNFQEIWRIMKVNFKDKFVNKRKPSGLAFYMQVLEDTNLDIYSPYLRRLEYNGQFNTRIYGKFSNEE